MSRKDGRLLTNLDSFQRFYTYLMPGRVQSTCFTMFQIDATELLRYIKNKKDAGFDVTVFHVVVAALLRAGSQYPELNRFIYGHKFYARNSFSVGFAINRGSKTLFKKVSFDPEDTLLIVSEKICSAIKYAIENPHDDATGTVDMVLKLPGFLTSLIVKLYPWLWDKGLLPKFLISDDDPLYSSAMISNLGTFGVSKTLHHLYEWGNVTLFVTMGNICKAPIVGSDGTIKAADVIDFVFSIDERVCDGKQLTNAMNYFKKCIAEPWLLDSPPEKVVRE